MSTFKPNTPYTVPFYLLMAAAKEKKKGVLVKEYTRKEKPMFCSFRTFGGTEKTVNDMLVVENTAVMETWYHPDIKADSRVEVNGITYEILGTPENIDMRNQWMRFKVRAIKGGA